MHIQSWQRKPTGCRVSPRESPHSEANGLLAAREATFRWCALSGGIIVAGACRNHLPRHYRCLPERVPPKETRLPALQRPAPHRTRRSSTALSRSKHHPARPTELCCDQRPSSKLQLRRCVRGSGRSIQKDTEGLDLQQKARPSPSPPPAAWNIAASGGLLRTRRTGNSEGRVDPDGTKYRAFRTVRGGSRAGHTRQIGGSDSRSTKYRGNVRETQGGTNLTTACSSHFFPSLHISWGCLLQVWPLPEARPHQNFWNRSNLYGEKKKSTHGHQSVGSTCTDFRLPPVGHPTSLQRPERPGAGSCSALGHSAAEVAARSGHSGSATALYFQRHPLQSDLPGQVVQNQSYRGPLPLHPPKVQHFSTP